MKTFTILFYFLVAWSLAGADWLQFRGPNGAGISPESGLPDKLTTNNIAWSADLPGRGLSSPIIVGGRVFVTCSSGPRQGRLHVICLSATDGSKLWERQFWATGRTMCHEKTAVAASTPASDGERVYAIFSSNDLVCLDLEGNLLWLRGLTLDYPNASNSLGMSSSLAVHQGVLVAMVENDTDSFAGGFDIRTGQNRWKMARPKMANWTSPILLSSPSGPATLLLQSGKGIAAVDPVAGQVLWEYTEGASTIPSSAVSDGVLYVPSRGLTALRAPSSGKTPAMVWRSGQLRAATASPLALQERLFILNDAGVLTCATTTNGTRLWQLRLKGPFSASPVAAGGLLYCVNEKGIIQVVDPAAPEGAVLSELDLGKTILSTPSIANGALYVRSDAKLWQLRKS